MELVVKGGRGLLVLAVALSARPGTLLVKWSLPGCLRLCLVASHRGSCFRSSWFKHELGPCDPLKRSEFGEGPLGREE